MHIYPGTNPIAFGASGAPGVVVNPQPSGYGLYSLPQVTDDGVDNRNSANQMAAAEANRDAINWIVWRLPDLISGGNYISVLNGYVQLGNAIVFDHSGVADSNTGVVGKGGSAGGIGGQFYGGGANADGVQGYGSGTRFGGVFTSGASAPYAVWAIGKTGSGAGAIIAQADGAGYAVKAIPGASQTVAYWANGGTFWSDLNVATNATNPGANQLWATNIPKSFGFIALDGAGGAAVDPHGFNMATAAVDGTDHTKVNVTFARNMAAATYAVLLTPFAPAGGGLPYFCVVVAQSPSGFSFKVYDPVATGGPAFTDWTTVGVPTSIGALVMAWQ